MNRTLKKSLRRGGRIAPLLALAGMAWQANAGCVSKTDFDLIESVVAASTANCSSAPPAGNIFTTTCTFSNGGKQIITTEFGSSSASKGSIEYVSVPLLDRKTVVSTPSSSGTTTTGTVVGTITGKTDVTVTGISVSSSGTSGSFASSDVRSIASYSFTAGPATGRTLNSDLASKITNASYTLTSYSYASFSVTYTLNGVTITASGGPGSFPLNTGGDANISSDASSTLLRNEVNACAATPTVTAPAAPGNISVVAGNGQVTVNFAAPSDNGGSPITGYTASCTSASGAAGTANGAGSPITVSGLTNGASYMCAVKASNTAGSGTASANSTAVTPAAPVVTPPTTPTTPTASDPGIFLKFKDYCDVIRFEKLAGDNNVYYGRNVPGACEDGSLMFARVVNGPFLNGRSPIYVSIAGGYTGPSGTVEALKFLDLLLDPDRSAIAGTFNAFGVLGDVAASNGVRLTDRQLKGKEWFIDTTAGNGTYANRSHGPRKPSLFSVFGQQGE